MNVLVNYATSRFSALRNLNSAAAIRVGGFDKVLEYSPRDLDPAFRERNAHILKHARGGGYWIWKPYIIDRALKTLHEDDFLFYADAGSFFIESVAPLIETMRRTSQDVVAFSLKRQKERMWTKNDTFVLMDCHGARYTDTHQVEASFSLWRKTPFTLALAAEWLHYAQDERIVTDAPNRCGGRNFPEFREHRHDQSIWSLLCKKHGVALHRQPWRPPDDAFPHSAYPRLLAFRVKRPTSLLRFCVTHPAHVRLHGPVLRTALHELPPFLIAVARKLVA